MADTEDLPDEIKRFIVMRLACWDTPSQVAEAVKDEFEIVVSRQRVHVYDPTKKAGSELSDGLKKLFIATRKKFLDDTSEIGIAHKSVRLRMLDRAARKAETIGNYMGMAELCERAAKEVGEAYTNKHKHELTGKDGKPLAAAPTATIVLTGRPAAASASKAVERVRKRRD